MICIERSLREFTFKSPMLPSVTRSSVLLCSGLVLIDATLGLQVRLSYVLHGCVYFATHQLDARVVMATLYSAMLEQMVVFIIEACPTGQRSAK